MKLDFQNIDWDFRSFEHWTLLPQWAQILEEVSFT